MRILCKADREQTRHLLLIYYIIRHFASVCCKKKEEQNNPRSRFRLFIARKSSSTNTRQLLTSCRVALVREFTTCVDSARWSRAFSNCIASRTYFPASRTVMNGRSGFSHSCTVSCQFFSEKDALTEGVLRKKKKAEHGLSPVIPRDVINTLQS